MARCLHLGVPSRGDGGNAPAGVVAAHYPVLPPHRLLLALGSHILRILLAYGKEDGLPAQPIVGGAFCVLCTDQAGTELCVWLRWCRAARWRGAGRDKHGDAGSRAAWTAERFSSGAHRMRRVDGTTEQGETCALTKAASAVAAAQRHLSPTTPPAALTQRTGTSIAGLTRRALVAWAPLKARRLRFGDGIDMRFCGKLPLLRVMPCQKIMPSCHPAPCFRRPLLYILVSAGVNSGGTTRTTLGGRRGRALIRTNNALF